MPLLSRRECRSLMCHLESKSRTPGTDWRKGDALSDWVLYRVAADPRLLNSVRSILGEDIVLWGCSVVRQGPRDVHPWHVDIETSAPNGRFVTAWIGIENTARNGGLELIAGSHLVEQPIQQVQAEHGYRRGEAPVGLVLAWARERNGSAALVRPEFSDGDAVLFDGRLWHGSRNRRHTGSRTALLLQFAAADSAVRRHNENKLEWPFEQLDESPPPAILMLGGANDEIHRLVPPPAPDSHKDISMLSSCVMPLNLPLDEKPGGGWKPYQLFGGTTRIVDHMNCHVSVLSEGHCPHPPHAHDEEELLIVLDGHADLVIADETCAAGTRVQRVGPGAFAYYPAFHHHTIRNPGPGPVTYMMLKWHVRAAKPGANPLRAAVFDYEKARAGDSGGWITQAIMEGPTGWLGQLHCHVSWLEPAAGYAPHADAYDVAVLTLSGRVETLGREVPPQSVVYYAAGEKHGMRNVGDEPAHYLVFEFHPSTIDLGRRLHRRFGPVAKQALKRGALAVGVDLGQLRARFSGRA